jgi:rRNA maturation endonuclease Nob1
MPTMPNTIRDPYPKTKKKGASSQQIAVRVRVRVYGSKGERVRKKKPRSQRPVLVPFVKPYHKICSVCGSNAVQSQNQNAL